MERIIINVQDDTPPQVAVECVRQVVEDGRQSSATVGGEKIKTYCWHSSFSIHHRNGDPTKRVHVSVKPNSKGSTSFFVWTGDEQGRPA